MAKIDGFFKFMKEKGGSDLHLSVGNMPMVRISGDLVQIHWQVLTPEINKALLYEIMGEERARQFEEILDIDFAYAVPEIESRFRANIFMERQGLGAVFRMIPSKILTAEELGLPPAILNFGALHKGLVVVTGGTGSGKSTTLAAIIDHVNKTQKGHIITIEDPIEFVHHSQSCLVNQRELKNHTKSFASALRAALREDPNVILIGEMRDLETIELAITAAETGHLVFGTLHTTSAAKTVDRIINVFPTDQQEQIRMMLSESLRGVVAQQLCRKIDRKGRVAAIEILVVTPAVSNLIRENKTFQIPTVIQVGKKDGMQLMDQALLDLLKQKKISADEAFGKAHDHSLFQQYAHAPAAPHLHEHGLADSETIVMPE